MADETDDPQPHAADAADVAEWLATPPTPYPVEEKPARLPLGILAGLVVAAVGVVVWGAIALFFKEYVGVAVIIGVAVGVVVRDVSRRSTVPVRVAAAVITAIACAVGTLVGPLAATAGDFDISFWTLFRDASDSWGELLKTRNALTYAIYAAALVVAVLSAAPKKDRPAPVPARDEDGEPPAMDLTRS